MKAAIDKMELSPILYDLKERGKTWDQITEIMNKGGHNYGKSTFNNWYNDFIKAD